MSDTFEQFYDGLGPAYDEMTGFDARLEKERKFVQSMLSRYQIRTAVDAGCGTGVHSFALVQCGVQVTGVDISGEMIEMAKKHAADLRLPAAFRQADLCTLSSAIPERVDAVFCLGNTLAHCVSAGDLGTIVREFERILMPGAIIAVQVLNYERILMERPRIINTRQAGECTYVRYYAYLENTLLFNVLTLCKKGSDVKRTLLSTPLYPVRRSELESIMQSIGYRCEIFGGTDMSSFDSLRSRDLFLIAQSGSYTS